MDKYKRKRKILGFEENKDEAKGKGQKNITKNL